MGDEFGVTARALRFYEDEALIQPERKGTQRLYTDRDRARLAWILRGKRVGLSLTDIKELLDLYDLGDGRETQRVKTIERCREQLDRLRRAVADWTTRGVRRNACSAGSELAGRAVVPDPPPRSRHPRLVRSRAEGDPPTDLREDARVHRRRSWLGGRSLGVPKGAHEARDTQKREGGHEHRGGDPSDSAPSDRGDAAAGRRRAPGPARGARSVPGSRGRSLVIVGLQRELQSSPTVRGERPDGCRRDSEDLGRVLAAVVEEIGQHQRRPLALGKRPERPDHQVPGICGGEGVLGRAGERVRFAATLSRRNRLRVD